METEVLFLGMDKKEIGFFRFLLEAYEGIGVLSTLDNKRGIVVVRIAPGCMELVLDVAGALESAPMVLTHNNMRALGFSLSEFL